MLVGFALNGNVQISVSVKYRVFDDKAAVLATQDLDRGPDRLDVRVAFLVDPNFENVCFVQMSYASCKKIKLLTLEKNAKP
jgi:regulator of protease activity HflC (stomatin/prohibitin superfamily)